MFQIQWDEYPGSKEEGGEMQFIKSKRITNSLFRSTTPLLCKSLQRDGGDLTMHCNEFHFKRCEGWKMLSRLHDEMKWLWISIKRSRLGNINKLNMFQSQCNESIEDEAPRYDYNKTRISNTDNARDQIKLSGGKV